MLCRSIANGHFCIVEYVSEGLYNHLHPVTNKRLPNISSLSDIAAVMSASAHVHVKTIGSKILEDSESTGLYFPFLLVSSLRITLHDTDIQELYAWYTKAHTIMNANKRWFCIIYFVTK